MTVEPDETDERIERLGERADLIVTQVEAGERGKRTERLGQCADLIANQSPCPRWGRRERGFSLILAFSAETLGT